MSGDIIAVFQASGVDLLNVALKCIDEFVNVVEMQKVRNATEGLGNPSKMVLMR